MTTKEPPPPPGVGPASGPASTGSNRPAVTRAGMAWASTVASLILLILLIIFIVQNQNDVTIAFFGLQGTIASGVALLIAAVGGGVLVAVAGAARILQLRAKTRNQQKA